MSTGTTVLSDLSPGRTYALIVGIERYDVHSSWNLPGAARDAVRFAEWLTGPGGVPPENVRLFTSSLEAGRHSSRIPREDATERNINQALFNELPTWDGDLLWIFWAGHGFQDGAEQLLLPYSEATAERTAHLNLNSALRWLKGLPGGTFRHQIAIADSCRTDERQARGLTLGSVDYGSVAVRSDRRQSRLYATMPGDVAKNLADRLAGLFTDLLLDELGKRNACTGAEELPEVARSLQRRLRQAAQTPQFIDGRDWNDSSLFDYSPAEPVPRLDNTAWRELKTLAGEQDLPAYTYDAVLWAFASAECAAPPISTLPPPEDGLTALVRDLEQRQGRSGVPFSLLFARCLAAHAEDPDWGVRLDSWVDRTSARLGVGAVPPAPARRATAPELHIQLRKSGVEGAYLVDIWLHHDSFDTVWCSRDPLDVPAARQELGGQLGALLERFASDGGEQTSIDRIEFHLPFELLSEQVEEWELPIGRRGRLLRLGGKFEVVVRCPEERTGAAYHLWKRKWAWFKAYGGGEWALFTPGTGLPSQPIWLLGRPSVSARLGLELQADRHVPVCVLAGVSAEELPDALDAVLEAGVPIAVWRRDGPPNGGAFATDAPGLDRALAPAGTHVNLRELPQKLRRLRIEGMGVQPQDQTWEHGLALLWDDPERRPERLRLG
ncbi:VMAP-C domain-containing protein [Streptomyces sp. NPDC002276]